MDQICFTTGGIGLITLLLGAMAAGMRILYQEQLKGQQAIILIQNTQIKAQQDQILSMRATLDRMLTLGENQAEVQKDLVQTAKNQIAP